MPRLETVPQPNEPRGDTRRCANRPLLSFDRYDEVPIDEPGALLLAADYPIRTLLQKGFYLMNDGGPAYEITIESFTISPSVLAKSKNVSRIAEKGNGFAYVWLDGYPPYIYTTEKWNLIGAIAKAADARYDSSAFHPDYKVSVSAVYRDADMLWYCSTADMIYIQSQGRITFGPTTHLVCGLVRPFGANPAIRDSSAADDAVLGGGLDFTSAVGRGCAVAAYTRHRSCSQAALARTANVDPADLSKWKKGSLPSTSDKKTRIERVIKNNDPPTRAARPARDL
jgi:hypothetical protein